MARKRKSASRDTSDIASDPLVSLPVARPSLLSLEELLTPAPLMPEIEDRRLFHPEQDVRPALSISTTLQAPVSVRRAPRIKQTRALLAFDVPQQVAVCVRRKSRREVLFAKRRTRSGRGRSRRRSYWSAISCR